MVRQTRRLPRGARGGEQGCNIRRRGCAWTAGRSVETDRVAPVFQPFMFETLGLELGRLDRCAVLFDVLGGWSRLLLRQHLERLPDAAQSLDDVAMPDCDDIDRVLDVLLRQYHAADGAHIDAKQQQVDVQTELFLQSKTFLRYIRFGIDGEGKMPERLLHCYVRLAHELPSDGHRLTRMPCM